MRKAIKNSRKDARIFAKTAKKSHKYNSVRTMFRGGIRLYLLTLSITA